MIPDLAGFLYGFQVKMAESVAAGPIKEKLYDYPLNDPEPTVARKSMDQSPPFPEDKARLEAMDSVSKEKKK